MICFCCKNGPDGSGRCTHYNYLYGQPPLVRCVNREGHNGEHKYSGYDGRKITYWESVAEVIRLENTCTED